MDGQDYTYLLTEKCLSVNLMGRMFIIKADRPNFKRACDAVLAGDWANVRRAMDLPAEIARHSEGNIKFRRGGLFYRDELIRNVVGRRVLDLIRVNGNFKPLMRFLGRLMENPSRRSVNELYTFLKHKNLPFTPDGKFLAYMVVRQDWTDHRAGKLSNKVGDVNEVTHDRDCDDADKGGSDGFDAGSLEYAKSFEGDTSHIIVIEIDPADVVSVPEDCECQKLRTARYKVVGVYCRALGEPVVDAYFDGSYDHETGEIT